MTKSESFLGGTHLLFAGAPEPLPSKHPAQYGAPSAVRGEGRPDGGRLEVVHLRTQVRIAAVLFNMASVTHLVPSALAYNMRRVSNPNPRPPV